MAVIARGAQQSPANCSVAKKDCHAPQAMTKFFIFHFSFFIAFTVEYCLSMVLIGYNKQHCVTI